MRLTSQGGKAPRDAAGVVESAQQLPAGAVNVIAQGSRRMLTGLEDNRVAGIA